MAHSTGTGQAQHHVGMGNMAADGADLFREQMLGVLFHVTYTLVGVGLLIQQSLWLFNAIKLAGAARGRLLAALAVGSTTGRM